MGRQLLERGVQHIGQTEGLHPSLDTIERQGRTPQVQTYLRVLGFWQHLLSLGFLESTHDALHPGVLRTVT